MKYILALVLSLAFIGTADAQYRRYPADPFVRQQQQAALQAQRQYHQALLKQQRQYQQFILALQRQNQQQFLRMNAEAQYQQFLQWRLLNYGY